MPLADKIRPKNLDEIAGQAHLLAPGKPLCKIIESGSVPNMLFYGPPGVGKTTVANIIAEKANMNLHRLNGTSASTADIKAIIAQTGTLMGVGGTLLYLDEIQYLNKKQQQSLLEHIESGDITLIASTTENPYFYVYGAILSRCTVFEFKPLSADEIAPAVKRGFALSGIDGVDDGIVRVIAKGCGGDVRKALNAVELCVITCGGDVTKEAARELSQKSSMRYDRSGDMHYDTLSAFQKSIRGSDENAALHYLARLILAEDLPSICRRLLVIAAEDVGLAHPNAIVVAKACVDAALQLGLPEARIPLAQAVVMLCTSPKSNSAYLAVDAAIEDIESGVTGEIPRQLQNVHLDGEGAAVKGQNYLYPHDYPGHYVGQQYLPDEIKDRVYYKFGDNKNEQAAFEYRKRLLAALLSD